MVTFYLDDEVVSKIEDLVVALAKEGIKVRKKKTFRGISKNDVVKYCIDHVWDEKCKGIHY